MIEHSTPLANFANSLRHPRILKIAPQLPHVAVILDDFSTQCFEGDANLWPITPQRPILDMSFVRPDLLLVESAWNGNQGAWRYMVTANNGPKPAFVKLLLECKMAGIPTVFWNKEDPPHFHEFINTAKLFDYVLTTDAEMIPRYQSHIPGVNAGFMRFAAAGTVHSPERVAHYRSGDIAFAGQYFAHKFPERREQMDLLFPAAAQHEFAIYSRALGAAPEYQFPTQYEKHVIGSLPYEAMVKAYRQHKIFLNVNSVVSSQTMCARRVFELSACKTAVVGVRSQAVESVYPSDEVLQVETYSDAENVFTKLLDDEWFRRRVTQRAWRRTLAQHTYAHRMQQILALIHGHHPPQPTNIHIFTKGDRTNRPFQEDITKQEFKLLDVPVTITQSVLSDGPGAAPRDAYVAVMDSAYRYGRHYLLDLFLTLRQQRTQYACKAPGDSLAHEESHTTELPHHGWLGTPMTLSHFERWIEEGPTPAPASAYMTDPLEVAPVQLPDSPTLTEVD